MGADVLPFFTFNAGSPTSPFKKASSCSASGHSAGDFALVHAAQLVHTHIRETDVAARLGGDEFAIILEEVDETQAQAKADQLDAVLRGTECRYGEVILPLSASIGWSMVLPHDTVDALIERADIDMYRRKRASYEAGSEDRAA